MPGKRAESIRELSQIRADNRELLRAQREESRVCVANIERVLAEARQAPDRSEKLAAELKELLNAHQELAVGIARTRQTFLASGDQLLEDLASGIVLETV